MAFEGGWGLVPPPPHPRQRSKIKFWGCGVGKYFFVRPWENDEKYYGMCEKCRDAERGNIQIC